MHRHDSEGGAYSADRAAALSGVPKSTVHYWARKSILVPSVSQERVKLWSFDDLLKLRTIYWLRQPKTARDGGDIPPSKMGKIRTALEELDQLGLRMWDGDVPRIFADRTGHVFLKRGDGTLVDGTAPDQTFFEFIDIVAPFSVLAGVEGPDLLAPRPHLRIVPGKLAGSPHIESTRIETQALASLSLRGFDIPALARLYPHVAPDAIREAIDLESQLESNLSAVA